MYVHLNNQMLEKFWVSMTLFFFLLSEITQRSNDLCYIVTDCGTQGFFSVNVWCPVQPSTCQMRALKQMTQHPTPRNPKVL